MGGGHKLVFIACLKKVELGAIALEDIVDNIFKFVEISRKFSKRVENGVGKGEIAHHKQFLLLLQFSKDLYCRHINTQVCLGKS